MSFTVNSGTTDTKAKTVNNSDTGTIQANGTLSAATAITWTGGSVTPGVVIDNFGTVTATTRDIDTSSSFNSASLTVNNHAGALMIASGNDAIRVDTSVNTGTLTIDNAGKLVSGALNASGQIIAHSSGQAIDLSAITNSTYTTNITNENGGLIGASGSDAIDLGYGIVTVTNHGLIDATASANRGINLDGDTTNHITSFTLTNGSDGTIQAQGDAVRLSGSTKSTSATGTVSLDNSGVIKSTATGSAGGQAIDFDDLVSASAHITITNESTGVISAADNDAIRTGNAATINNYGHITAHSTGTDANAIDLVSNTSVTIHNYAGGVIEGAKHAITGAAPITITNAGTLTGDLGSGINLDTAGTTTAMITNTGTITGTAAGSVKSGDAIDVDGGIHLDNYGTIQTIGTSTVSTNEAVTVGTGTINNYAGGVIHSVQNAIDVDGGTDSVTGAELNDFGAVTVYNEGTIISDNNIAVSIFGAFGDTVTNKGSITGLISTGAGNDIFNLYGGSSITGTIDGGTGTDTINLLGTGSGTVGTVVSVETVNVSSGSWTLGSEGFTTVHFAAASLTIGLANATLTDGHYTGTFTGMAAGDAFDLKGVGTETSATVGTGNVLTIVGGSTITLQLDPSQSFAGHTFHVTADGAGGSLVTMA